MTHIIKPAATILLARDNQGILEVLLLKRSKALVFAGGLWVFPGGKIEMVEIAESENELEAAKRAAIRETEEEAQISIAPEQLIFFRHWTTPALAPRRYGTWFFFAAVDKTHGSVVTDDEEIKDFCWMRPQDAIELVGQGKMGMMPPTLLSLHLIRDCRSVAEIQTSLMKETPRYLLPAADKDELSMMSFSQEEVAFGSQAKQLDEKDWCLYIDISSGYFQYQIADDLELKSRILSLSEVDL